jgi:hypothetical protein
MQPGKAAARLKLKLSGWYSFSFRLAAALLKL